MDIFLGSLIGAIVWTFGNVLYLDLRRKGIRRGRLLAFFVGWPGTLFTAVSVREGTVPQIEPPPDDVDRLLREIRVDRELRGEFDVRRGGADERWGNGPEAPPGA
jgi:hypothetical protein